LVGQKRFKVKNAAARLAAVRQRWRGAHGERHASSFIRTLTVGPSIGLGLLTLLSGKGLQALAGSQLSLSTAGGEFHPALKTHRS
jgi:hypothetical protein